MNGTQSRRPRQDAIRTTSVRHFSTCQPHIITARPRAIPSKMIADHHSGVAEQHGRSAQEHSDNARKTNAALREWIPSGSVKSPLKVAVVSHGGGR